MLLVLYKTVSDRNTVNKVLTDPLEIEVNFKRGFDVLEPKIDLLAGDVDYKGYNYLAIPSLNRFYFINAVEFNNYRIASLVCECDYLETHKAGILGVTGVFKKVIQDGDFGELDLQVTGRDIKRLFESDVKIEKNENIILSVLGGEARK